jgi:hypothetical protein
MANIETAHLQMPFTHSIALHSALGKSPFFFIVGAPRCGTTALAEYLSHHPDIFMAKKEMHHFGSDLCFGQQFYRRDRNAYLAEFDGWGGQSRAGEASVWYLFSKLAAAEIKAFNPNSRIIIMLRKPADLLSSLYNVFRCDGNEHLPTFRAALAAEHDRRAGRRIGRRTYLSQGLVYHEVACFTEQVRRYVDLFGRERVHVILYDDFATKTARVYGEVLDFLGVDSTRVPESFPVINGNVSAKTVRSSLIRNVLSDPLVRGTAIALSSRLPRPFLSALQNVEARLTQMNHRHVERPLVDEDLQEQLRIDFTPEIERLSELLGRDLTYWNRNTTSVQKPDLEPATH